MDKIRKNSLKTSMAAGFLITISILALLSIITIYLANQAQQKVLKKRYLTISSPDFQIDERTGSYILDIDSSHITWQPLSVRDNLVYYGSYGAMLALPVIYTVCGIGIAAAVYYRKKLRTPILQLQSGVERIQENDLDFHIAYNSSDELGQLCCSMEKMRKELRQNHKALWEALEQRRLLNTSVAHDLRTPLTVLKGYLEHLEKNASQDTLIADELLDTVAAMQGAVMRLEHYAECVQNIEKIENIEIVHQEENTEALLREIESNARQLAQEKEIYFSGGISADAVDIDKNILFRILENFLQNALRYAERQIKIDIFQKDKFLVLTVKDDGKGFTETGLRKAADVFYSTEKGTEHFGIGLSVCRMLSEKHGGSLSVANNKERGACVTARLKIF